MRISQGSLVVTATTVAVIAVTVPRHSSSQLQRLLDPPRAPKLHMSERQAARASGSVWTLDAPAAPSASSWGPRGFSPSSVFTHFELPAPDRQAQGSHLRASR